MDTLAIDNGRLIGTADYDYFWTGKDLTMKGTLTVDGRFWPNVTMQVGPSFQGQWKTIESPNIAGRSATFTAQADSSRPLLFVNLEGFAPYLARLACGRLVLENGEATTFRLDDLEALKKGRKSPTRIDCSRDWSIDMNFGGLPNPAIKPPLLIVNISEGDGQLIGEIMYMTTDKGILPVAEGARTKDGKVWLSGAAQIASDYRGIWVTIGHCPAHGEPIKVHFQSDDPDSRWQVDLNLFRMWVGRYRYGRVLLTNGVSATFEMKDILPP